MSATSAPSNGALTVHPGTKLLGEILSWSCAGLSVKHIDLVDALREARLDENVARELLPRHAFARACRKLAKGRVSFELSPAGAPRSIGFDFSAPDYRAAGVAAKYFLSVTPSCDRAYSFILRPRARR
jgi:hypothetical protein